LIRVSLENLQRVEEKVDRLRKEQHEGHDAMWKLWERAEEHIDRLHRGIKESGPAQATEIARVSLDRMAQIAMMRLSQPSVPLVEPPRTHAVPVAESNEDDWSDGADEMKLKG
jgi:hypothetical protein